MTYKAKYQELVELSHSDNPMIREQADAWLVSIGLQDAAKLKVSAFYLIWQFGMSKARFLVKQ